MRALLLGFAGILLATGCTTAPPQRAPAPPPRVAAASPAAQAVAYLAISAADAAIMREYYRVHPAQQRGRGRGRGGLPPGIAKNLARGKPLPPGIARQVMPQELYVRVRPLPSGYQYLVVAGKILLIETATGLIHDVLTDILFG